LKRSGLAATSASIFLFPAHLFSTHCQKPIELLPHPIDRRRGRIPLTRGHGDRDSRSSEKRRLLRRPGYERGVLPSNLSCGGSANSRERPRCVWLAGDGPRPAPKAAGLAAM